jgi:hypothetical protein
MIEVEQFSDPERKLWAYVLLQALTDLDGRDPLARSARLWISSKDNAIGSFSWVCHHLSLDPDAVRQRVLRRASQAARDAAANLAQPTNRAA